MESGRLRDRLTIQHYTTSIASNGETVKDWSTFATVFASIRPLSGREYFASSQKVQAELSHEITIRYLEGITSKMRGTDGARTFEFVSVLPDRTNSKFIKIFANEIKL